MPQFVTPTHYETHCRDPMSHLTQRHYQTLHRGPTSHSVIHHKQIHRRDPTSHSSPRHSRSCVAFADLQRRKMKGLCLSSLLSFSPSFSRLSVSLRVSSSLLLCLSRIFSSHSISLFLSPSMCVGARLSPPGFEKSSELELTSCLRNKVSWLNAGEAKSRLHGRTDTNKQWDVLLKTNANLKTEIKRE